MEIDDDTQRLRGTGGYYVLWWRDAAEGYDDWLETWDGVRDLLADVEIEWLTADESRDIPGRHQHDAR